MQLAAYLDRFAVTLTEMGSMIGCSPTTVLRHAEGRNQPDSKTIERYVSATDGCVTLNDWHQLALNRDDVLPQHWVAKIRKREARERAAA